MKSNLKNIEANFWVDSNDQRTNFLFAVRIFDDNNERKTDVRHLND
jgi:hypothetical protein